MIKLSFESRNRCFVEVVVNESAWQARQLRLPPPVPEIFEMSPRPHLHALPGSDIFSAPDVPPSENNHFQLTGFNPLLHSIHLQNLQHPLEHLLMAPYSKLLLVQITPIDDESHQII